MKETENAELQKFITELLSNPNFNQTVDKVKKKIDEIVSASNEELEKFDIIELNFDNKNSESIFSELNAKKTPDIIKKYLDKTKNKITSLSDSDKTKILYMFLIKIIEYRKNKSLGNKENTEIKPSFFSKMLLNFTHWFNQSLIYTYIILTLFVILSLVIGAMTIWERWANENKTSPLAKQISKDLKKIYSIDNDDKNTETGILKTLIDKFPKQPGTPTLDIKKPQTEKNSPAEQKLQIDQSVSEGIVSKLKDLLPNDQKIKTLNDVLVELKKFKVEELQKKIEVKLDDNQIKTVFNLISKDENSDFGKMVKKINGTSDKKLEKNDDIASAKDKKELASFKSEIDKLNKSIGERDKEISKEKASVTILNGEVDKKNKEIDKLETKLKSIGDEKTGFKGLTGSFAILFTNSKDFPLNQSILSTAFTLIEKQPKDQKFGVYIATGNQIAANLDLRDNKVKSMNLISPTGSPTEMLSDAGQAFLDYAFDGKNPIPIPDRKAIIIATWSAEAPKFNSSGWKDISQVDAILIQPANVQQIRYAKSWLDFVNQKNGRLLLISGPDNFDAGSDNLKQLSKQISTLLNTKKD